MKKIVKRVLAVLGCMTALTYCINKLFFMLAGAPQKTGNLYGWRFGNIHYTVCGEGKPLLLIHRLDIGASKAEWQNNIHELSKHYKVYAIDLLGFGNSDKPKITYTAYMYTQLIHDFIEEVIGMETTVIASGQSSAFSVMACTFDEKNIQKLLLLNPTGFCDEMPGKKEILLRRLIECPILGTAVYNFVSAPWWLSSYFNKMVKNPSTLPASFAMDHYKSGHQGGLGVKYAYGSYVTKFTNVDIKPHIQKLSVPIYSVWGEEHPLCTKGMLALFEELVPYADIAVFSETKLLPHFENPKGFMEICREFIQ